MKRITLVGLAIVAVLALRAAATEYVWQSTTDGMWTTSANWNPSTGYPNDPADEATFPNLFLATNQTLTVTLPANAVTVGVLRVILASNTYLLAGGRLVMTNSVSTNALIYATTPGANLPRIPAYVVIQSELEIYQDTVIAMPQYNLVDGLQIAGPLHGQGMITRSMAAAPGGYCSIMNRASTYSGLLRAHSGYSTYVYNNALSNAAGVAVSYNGSFGSYGVDTIRRITINTAGQLSYSGGSAGNSYGDWFLNCTNAVFTAFAGRTLYGALEGTGIVTFAGNTTITFLGAIRPGLGGVGSLTFVRGSGTPVLGSAASRAQLQIEISGSGGEPGVDHDYLKVQSLVAPLNLSNIVLHVTGTGGTTTNWFLEAPGTGTIGFVGTFFSVTNAPGLHSQVFYDSDNRRVGVVAIPEPALLLVWLAGLLCARRR